MACSTCKEIKGEISERETKGAPGNPSYTDATNFYLSGAHHLVADHNMQELREVTNANASQRQRITELLTQFGG